jgi:hypothetical protein
MGNPKSTEPLLAFCEISVFLDNLLDRIITQSSLESIADDLTQVMDCHEAANEANLDGSKHLYVCPQFRSLQADSAIYRGWGEQ